MPARRPGARLAVWAVALALLVRLAVPQGWMPMGAGWRLVPCSGHGAMMVAAKGGHQHDGAPAADGACPFAAAALPLLDAAPPMIADLPPAAVAAIVASSFAVAVGRGLAAPPPPATGPPPHSA